MSCQWRQNSHDNWEMTQSNPPSELANDPIISTSSNPDERSSSPAAQIEHREGSCGDSPQKMTNSPFSNAAQAETEPIPRDNHMSNPEEMLLPSSPSHPSLPLDLGDHTIPRRVAKTETMHPLKKSSGSVEVGEDCNNIDSDDSDADFEMANSDGNKSDSTYIAEEATRHGKKRTSDKKPSSKTANKSKATAKGKTAAKEPKANTTKGRQRKIEATSSKAAPKRAKQATDAIDMQDSMIGTKTKPVSGQNRTSRHFRKGGKDSGVEESARAVQNSQSPPKKHQTKPMSSTARLPKKSFYGESNDSPLAQVAQDARGAKKETKSQPISNTGSKNKPALSIRKQPRTASPLRVNDDDNMYIPESPTKQEYKLPQKASADKTVLSSKLDVAVGPNSKKKRSPIRTGPKPVDSKNSPIRTYGQKPGRSIDASIFRHEPNEQENGQIEESESSTSKHAKSQGLGACDSNPNEVVSNKDTSLIYMEENNEFVKQKPALRKILQKPLSEFTITIKDSEPSMDKVATTSQRQTPEELQIASTPEAVEKVSVASESVVGVTKDVTGHMVPKSVVPRKEAEQLAELSSNQDQRLSKESASLKQVLGRKSSAGQKLPDHNELEYESKMIPKASPVRRVELLLPNQNTGFIQKEVRRGDMRTFEKENKAPILSKGYLTPLVNTEDRRKPHINPEEAAGHPYISQSENISKPSVHRLEDDINLRYNRLNELQNSHECKERFQLSDRHQEQLRHRGLWLQQESLRFEPPLPEASIFSSVSYSKPRERSPAKPPPQKDVGSDHYIPNFRSRVALTSSPSENPQAKSKNNYMPQAPQLHPKSVGFASRVAQSYEQTDPSQEANQELLDRRIDYQTTEQLSWFQPKAARKSWNDPTPEPIDPVRLHNGSNGKRPGGHVKKQDISTSEPIYEVRWKKAVEAASDGVVDTLHYLSTSLLEHLRTREESVLAIVREYRREGTKVSEKLANRQTEEWRHTSTAVEQECLEITTLYEALSKETQSFQAKGLSKIHNKKYEEWREQTARIKDAIRTAREKLILG